MRAILVAATFSGLCVHVGVQQLQHSEALGLAAGLTGPQRSGSGTVRTATCASNCRTIEEKFDVGCL